MQNVAMAPIQNARTHEHYVTINIFIKPGHGGLYQPDRTTIMAAAGVVVETPDNPRGSFQPNIALKQAAADLLYRTRLWTYPNLSFLLVRNDVKWEEPQSRTEVTKSGRPGKSPSLHRTPPCHPSRS